MERFNACLRVAAVVLSFGALTGCNGFLNISPGTGQRACTSANECDAGDLCINGVCSFGNNGTCWVYNPDGACSAGSHCVDGICTRNNVSGWCDCEPNDGCLNGQCVDISEDTICSAERPNGACLTGQVCVAGTCVEITPGNICSANRLNGLCPSGTGCVRGQCVPIAEDPCGPTNTDGLCPSGARCNSAGECQLVPCSPSAPNGACAQIGTYCSDGECVIIPCSRENPNGPCEDLTAFCSTEGRCIPNGTCAGDGDCDEGNYCGVAGVCRPNGTCVDPGDCGQFSTCNGGNCVRDLSCTDDTNCPSGEHCLNFPGGGQCGPTFACVDASDCDAGSYCSAIGECASSDQCFNNADCVGERCDYPSCRCSTVNTCIDINGCAVTNDCELGERCGGGACLPIESCNGNSGDAPTHTCSGSNCCDTFDQRCSTDLCIPVGRCRTDGDCGHGVQCNTTDGTCSVGTSCTRATEAAACGGGKFCNSYGVCATGTRNTDCTTPLDCPEGNICNGAFKCELGAACGGEEFSTTEVPPNMLILLDRSGSMNNVVTGNCQASNKRWDVAVSAISAVLADRDGHIRFGLSTYPSSNRCGGVQFCAGNECSNECIDGINGCDVNPIPSGSDADNNYEPGYVDRAVGSTPAQINQFLSSSGPGGRTPTARALRVIADNPAGYGLPATNDPVVRDNYILLVTDGDPNGATAGTSCADSCREGRDNRGCNANCMVNLQLDRLRGLPKPIRTFTVGFAFSSVKTNLNCNAVHGGTSLCAASVDASTCDDDGVGPCYYNANSPSALVTALSDISAQISGCTFTMDQAPPDIERLYIFTRDVVGGVPTGPYNPVSNNPSTPDGYYTLEGLRIQLFGAVCDRVREGEEKPIVVYGCPQPGG